MGKIFIIGLPRTGTTSISIALLNEGFKVAHTAFTKHAFETAEVISDSPCFSDYKQLDDLFPGSKFIYLQRELEQWLPSIRKLLSKMEPNLLPKVGHFNPVLKRSFEQIFHLSDDALLTDDHLRNCYMSHQSEVLKYFAGREEFISINISDSAGLQRVLSFLGIYSETSIDFPHFNQGEKVSSWKHYRHKNKINNLSAGKDQRRFFAYHYT